MLSQAVGDNDGWRLYGEAPATNEVRMVFEINDDIETLAESWIFRNKKTYTDYIARTEFFISGTGYSQSRVSSRAPIFYDSDDTNYFLDPTSNATSMRTAGSWITNGTSTWGGEVAGKLEYHNNRWYASVNTAFVVRSTAGSEVLWAYNTGVVEASNDFRAPIFYDSNNTSFYLDPTNTGDALIAAGSGAFGISFSKARITARRDTDGITPADSASIVLSNRSTAINGTLAGGIFMDTYRDIRDPHYAGGMWFTRNQTSGNLASGSDIVFGAMDNWDTGLPTERMRISATGPVTASVDFRGPIFYDSANTAFYGDFAGTSVLNTVRASSYFTSGSGVGRGLNPGGGQRGNNGASETGALKITLPQSWTSTMLRFTVKVYDYNTNTSFDVSCGGYNWGGASWVNTFGYIVGNPNVDRNFNIRFGHDGSRACVFIGELNSVWSYVQVAITDVQVGFSGFTADAWEDDWAISIVTSFPTLSGTTISNAQVGRYGTIFYDSNNTAFYIDPSSTSQVSGANFNFGSTGRIYDDGNFHIDGLSSPVWINSIGNSTIELNTQTSGYVNIGNSARAPIYYDSDNTTYFFDGTGGTRQSKFLTITGGGAGNNGNELIVGSTSVQFSLVDTNLRSIIQAHGAYPVLSLNHTITANDNHGPTIQLTSNGTGSQFVIGANGTGTRLSMGYSNASDWNPHNGISGYNGTSFFEATTTGFIGIGAPGDWGSLGSGSPAYHLHFKGNNVSTGGYAAVFQNLSNAVNGGGFLFQNDFGNHSWGMVSEFRTVSASDRPSISFSCNQTSTTWSIGYVQVDDNFRISQNHGHRHGSWGTARLLIDPSGNMTSYVSTNSPIFRDSDSTGYYVDPASDSVLANVVLASTIDSALYYDTALEIRERSFAGAQTTSLNNAPRLSFHWGGRVASQLVLDSANVLNLMNGDCTGWTTFKAGDIIGNILTDREDSAFFVNPNGSSVLSSLTVGGSQVMRGVGTAASNNTNWNDLGNTVNTIYQITQETFNVGGSGNINFPASASYKYGTLINFNANQDARAQMYISHAGNDLIFRGGWTNSSWQTWNKVLTDQNYTSYSPSLTGFGASGTWGISISGTAATATALSSTTNFFINRGDIAAASIDTATGLGVWNQVNVGDSHTILAFGASGSTSTVQQRFHYTGSMEFRNQTDSSVWTAWKTVLTSANYTSYSPSLTGSGASGSWGISVTGTATNLSTNRTNWSTNGTITAVVGQLAWKNYGNNHTIFDASNSTSPDGSAVNNTNAQVAWGGTYPTLMGWNGTNTYGVRVDSARVSDTTGSISGFNNPTTAPTASTIAYRDAAGDIAAREIILSSGLSSSTPTVLVSMFPSSNQLVRTTPTAVGAALSSVNHTWTGIQYFQSNRNTTSDSAPLQAFSTGGLGATMAFHRAGVFAVNMGLDSDNVFRIGGWSAAANLLQMDMSGNLTMLNNVTAYSDLRLKKDIMKIDNAIDKVMRLNGYTYTRIDTNIRQMGVIAQEVMEVIPEVVLGSEETNYSVAYGNIVGLLIEAIKEQQTSINKLQQEIISLKEDK